MTSPEQRDLLAQHIDAWVKQITTQGGGDQELLESMHDYMTPFKTILDDSYPGELDRLALKYSGFHQFADLLKRLAAGIADGRISVLDSEPTS